LRLSNSEIERYVENLSQEAKGIKDEIFRLRWYMRVGVSSQDLFHIYSYVDRMLINEIIKENIETTKKSGMPII
jgi:hypothetical protein